MSYTRFVAVIPHHSIAILTSTRANIEDARVRKLAEELVLAQRKEIAEMKYLLRALRRDGRSRRNAIESRGETMSAGKAARTADLATTDLEPIDAAKLQRVFAAA